MPTPLMKSFAKEAEVKPKKVEKLWKKAERLVKKKYEIEDDSDRFYPLVVGVLKNFLGIEKKDINEDGEGIDVGNAEVGTTTTNMGDYQHASRIGDPAYVMAGRIMPVQIEITKVKKRKANKKHKKAIRKLKECIEASDMDIDDAFSDMIKYFCEKDSLDPVEDAINSLNRYFGLAPSIFDNIE